MADNRFWVIGGEFRSTDFNEIKEGTGQIYGPFGSREEAQQVWRVNSEEHRSSCCTRFSVVQEGARASA